MPFLILTGSRWKTLMVARILRSRVRARSSTLGSLRLILPMLTPVSSLRKKGTMRPLLLMSLMMIRILIMLSSMLLIKER